MVVILCEVLIAQAFIWSCFLQGACKSDQCVPTGSNLSQTCVLVGIKVLLPLLLATGIVAILIKIDKKSK